MSKLALKSFFKSIIPKRFTTHPSSATVPEKPVAGPLISETNAVGTPYEKAVGLERLEYLANISSRPLFLMDPLKVDHYGTLSNPITVESIVGKRIVGCTGFPKDSHEVLWMWCKEGKPSRCPECGQAFKIRKVQ